ISINALDIFNPQTGRATPFDAYFAGKAPFKAADIYLANIIGPQKQLWVSTNKGELFLYDGAFKKVFHKEGVFFQYIAIDDKGNIWLGWGKNLMCVDSSGKVLEEAVLPDQIGGVYPGAGDSPWIATIPREKVNIWRMEKGGGVTPFSLSR